MKPIKRKKVVAEQKAKVPTKDEMISMRLTSVQLKRLDAYKNALERQMGLPVKRGWVVTRLIELGASAFEKTYGITKEDLNFSEPDNQ